MRKWTGDLKKSLIKELHYVLSICNHPTKVKFPDGSVETFYPPSRVIVSDHFFRSVKCRMCLKCCRIPFTNFWTMREFKVLKKMYLEEVTRANWEELAIEINGVPVSFMTTPSEPKIGCIFLDLRKGCRVHDANPVHCRVPLVKFKNRNGVTRVTKEPYGRNWQFHCKVQFGVLTREEFSSWDLEVMSRIEALANDLQVETRIQWLTREIERRFRDPLRSANILEL